MNTVTDIATSTEKIVKTAHEAAPYAESLAALIPGFGPQIAVAMKIADSFYEPILNALHTLMEKNGGDLVLAQAQLMAHINPNMPNTSMLSGRPAAT